MEEEEEEEEEKKEWSSIRLSVCPPCPLQPSRCAKMRRVLVGKDGGDGESTKDGSSQSRTRANAKEWKKGGRYEDEDEDEDEEKDEKDEKVNVNVMVMLIMNERCQRAPKEERRIVSASIRFYFQRANQSIEDDSISASPSQVASVCRQRVEEAKQAQSH
eukprot:GHVU01193532.1.p2 GENE.GHVU01193532.1~~GHVU01193532.1.p2  ORF type:complete len:160 (+),score=42.76 GHVU01193532.1:2111-2590(+)